MCKWTSSINSLLGKNGRYKKPTHDSGSKRNMRNLFIQSGHTYFGIAAGDFKYQCRQRFHRNKEFVK